MNILHAGLDAIPLKYLPRIFPYSSFYQYFRPIVVPRPENSMVLKQSGDKGHSVISVMRMGKGL